MPRRRERVEPQGDILSPFDLAKKLRGAVQAKDLKALERLFQRSEVCDMDDRSVAFVVRTAVEQHNSSAMALLFIQPAIQTMGPRAIAGLLQTAIRYKNVPAVLQLSKLEAAHDINRAYLSYLLEEATALGHAGAVQSLSALQGHQTELEQLIPAGSFAGALRTAVLQGRRQMVYHMIQHEALQATEPSIMAGILGTAIYHRSGVITRYLCWVHAAQLLPAASVCALLEAALQVGDSQAVNYICEELPGAQQMEADHIAKLLLAAMRQPDTTVFCRLCQLPAAQVLQPADVYNLLESALTDTAVCGVSGTVCALCELLPGVQHLTKDHLQQLLQTALPQHDSSAFTYLHNLPAAQELRTTGSLGATPRAARDSGIATSTASSRSSSPDCGSRLGRALSSSSSSSSSPISRRSRRSRRSTTSSNCSLSKASVDGVAVVLCKQFSGGKALQPEPLEELLLPY